MSPRETWLRLLLLLCARGRATDIHLEPKGQDYVLRVRIDAAMVEVCRVSNTLGLKLSALVKVLSEIDMTQKSTMQEGHFSSRVPGGRRGETRIGGRRRHAARTQGRFDMGETVDRDVARAAIRTAGAHQWIGWIDPRTRRQAVPGTDLHLHERHDRAARGHWRPGSPSRDRYRRALAQSRDEAEHGRSM